MTLFERARDWVAEKVRPAAVRDLTSEAKALTVPTASVASGRERAFELNAELAAEYGDAGAPMQPTQPIEEPLFFDYALGVNLVAQPRAGFGLLSFAQLKAMGDYCHELRLPIELMKREVRALEWDVIPKSKAERRKVSDEAKARIEEARTWLETPDGAATFDGFCNMLLEDVLVYDAATIYPAYLRGGDLDHIEAIDGTTIRPLLDARGRTPVAQTPAYIQVSGGLPVGSWTREQLWYLPFNCETRTPYGRTPAEMMLMALNTALRRAGFRLSYYSDGNIPEALVGLPEFTPDQVADYQEYFDLLLAGDTKRLRRIKFIPVKSGGSCPFTSSSGLMAILSWMSFCCVSAAGRLG